MITPMRCGSLTCASTLTASQGHARNWDPKGALVTTRSSTVTSAWVTKRSTWARSPATGRSIAPEQAPISSQCGADSAWSRVDRVCVGLRQSFRKLHMLLSRSHLPTGSESFARTSCTGRPSGSCVERRPTRSHLAIRLVEGVTISGCVLHFEAAVRQVRRRWSQ